MSLWYFHKTCDISIFGIFLWQRTCEFLAFYDCGPRSLWYFWVTTDLQVFGTVWWLNTCKFVLFFCEIAELRILGIFLGPWTCEILVFLKNYWPQPFWHFLWPLISEFVLFLQNCWPKQFWHFLWPRTCKFVVFLQNCWHIIFDILSDHILAIFGIICDRWPASYWYFYVSADLRVCCTFLCSQTCKILLFLKTADVSIFVIFLWPRTCGLVVFLQNYWPKHFWHLCLTADLRVLAFLFESGLANYWSF